LFEGQSLKNEKKNYKPKEFEPITLCDNDEDDIDNDKKQEPTQNYS